MTTKWLVTLADLHCGHRLGLLAPETQLPADDEHGHPEPWVPELSATQRWLWECYREDFGTVRDLVGVDPVVMALVGDLTWGQRYPEQCISENVVDQCLIALAALQPWGLLPGLQAVRLIHGTQSHEYGRGASPELVARLWATAADLDVRAVRHTLLGVDGVEFDLAHHGAGPGLREWTRGNVLELYTRSLMMSAIMAGETPPAAVVRAHYHDYARRTVRVTAGNVEHVTEAIALPSYCGLTHYAVQATRSAYLLACGLVAWEVRDGALAGVHTLWRRIDVRTREEL